MPRRKPEESPDERIARLRKQLAPEEYVKRLHADLTAIVEELFFINEKLDANKGGFDIPSTLIPTEHIVIVGFQFIDDNGLRGGDVRLLFRDCGVPIQVAAGLISAAQMRIERQWWENISNVGDGGCQNGDNS